MKHKTAKAEKASYKKLAIVYFNIFLIMALTFTFLLKFGIKQDLADVTGMASNGGKGYKLEDIKSFIQNWVGNGLGNNPFMDLCKAVESKKNEKCCSSDKKCTTYNPMFVTLISGVKEEFRIKLSDGTELIIPKKVPNDSVIRDKDNKVRAVVTEDKKVATCEKGVCKDNGNVRAVVVGNTVAKCEKGVCKDNGNVRAVVVGGTVNPVALCDNTFCYDESGRVVGVTKPGDKFTHLGYFKDNNNIYNPFADVATVKVGDKNCQVSFGIFSDDVCCNNKGKCTGANEKDRKAALTAADELKKSFEEECKNDNCPAKKMQDYEFHQSVASSMSSRVSLILNAGMDFLMDKLGLSSFPAMMCGDKLYEKDTKTQNIYGLPIPQVEFGSKMEKELLENIRTVQLTGERLEIQPDRYYNYLLKLKILEDEGKSVRWELYYDGTGGNSKKIWLQKGTTRGGQALEKIYVGKDKETAFFDCSKELCKFEKACIMLEDEDSPKCFKLALK